MLTLDAIIMAGVSPRSRSTNGCNGTSSKTMMHNMLC